MVTGPSFEEMLHPQTIDPAIRAQALVALQEDPLNPLNLYNITWRDGQRSRLSPRSCPASSPASMLGSY